MNNYQDDFRLNMKFYREKKRLSQVQLSIACNCGTGTIGGIESGKAKPSFEMILKIADALNVTPADLFIKDVSISKKEIKVFLDNQFKDLLSKL